MQSLRQLREAQGMSQHDLANALGCTRSYISHLETGRSTGPVQLLRKIADLFHVPIETLIDDSPTSAKTRAID